MEHSETKHEASKIPWLEGGLIDDLHILPAEDFAQCAVEDNIIEPDGVEYQGDGMFARVRICFETDKNDAWSRLERWLGILPMRVRPPMKPEDLLRMHQFFRAQARWAETMIEDAKGDLPEQSGWRNDADEVRFLGHHLADTLEQSNKINLNQPTSESVAYLTSRITFAVLRLMLRNKAKAVRAWQRQSEAGTRGRIRNTLLGDFKSKESRDTHIDTVLWPEEESRLAEIAISSRRPSSREIAQAVSRRLHEEHDVDLEPETVRREHFRRARDREQSHSG